MDKGFLTEQQRTVMKAILKRGSTQQRFARRINAVLLLDKGWSCADVVEAVDFRVRLTRFSVAR